MKEIVIIKNVHPNEQVAAFMADKVVEQLKEQGASVVVKDLIEQKIDWARQIARHPLERLHMVQAMAQKHTGSVIFDFQDSPAEQIAEFFPVEPAFITDANSKSISVEFPANYTTQTNTDVLKNAPLCHSESDRWFLLNMSDVEATMNAGLCRPEWITAVAQQVLRLAQGEILPSGMSILSELATPVSADAV